MYPNSLKHKMSLTISKYINKINFTENMELIYNITFKIRTKMTKKIFSGIFGVKIFWQFLENKKMGNFVKTP